METNYTKFSLVELLLRQEKRRQRFFIAQGPEWCVSFMPIPDYVRRADRNTYRVQLGFPVAARVYRMFDILVKMSVRRDFRTRNMTLSNIRNTHLEKVSFKLIFRIIATNPLGVPGIVTNIRYIRVYFS